jgi:hypothetical protein
MSDILEKHASFILVPENKDNMLFKNVGIQQDCVVSQPGVNNYYCEEYRAVDNSI